jgi:hypothetical protein
VRGGGDRGIDLRRRLRGRVMSRSLRHVFSVGWVGVATKSGFQGGCRRESPAVGSQLAKRVAGTDAEVMGRDVSVWSGLVLDAEQGSVS